MCTRAALTLGLLAISIPTVANHEVADVTACFALAGPTCGPVLASEQLTAFGAAAGTAQSPPTVEAALGLGRSTRRLIQQGLRNEGFDPGAPDGLFGPRTRAAIRSWQAAHGATPTGYLDGRQADLLRLAGSPRPATSEPVASPSPLGSESSAARALAPSCEEWNTEAYFESATPESVTACLSAGTDVAAPGDDGMTPLHWAAWSSTDPAVVNALLVCRPGDTQLNSSYTLPRNHSISLAFAVLNGPGIL